jgi:putative tryptophan/tyrosine transport system substrate-binding protein
MQVVEDVFRSEATGAARAQKPDKTPRVGYIRAGTSNNDPYRESFIRGMRDLGYVEGRNIAFEFRRYGDEVGSIPSLISDLLRAKVDIIVAGGTPAIRAAQAAPIPIVMIAADPLGTGSSLFVAQVLRKERGHPSGRRTSPRGRGETICAGG